MRMIKQILREIPRYEAEIASCNQLWSMIYLAFNNSGRPQAPVTCTPVLLTLGSSPPSAFSVLTTHTPRIQLSHFDSGEHARTEHLTPGGTRLEG